MSGLRITGGRARGRTLTGRAAPGVRPTSARVREALFSMVGQELTGVRVLDAFSGSGILAFEAWSRGAEVVAVERDPRAFAALRDHATALGADVRLVRGDLRKRLEGLGAFGLVFADPPYAEDPAVWLEVLAPACTGRIWFETAKATRVPDRCATLVREASRSFGDTTIHTYRVESA
ncbi:MAG: RsmD family RNA methyltransferase [Myxococcales bacterium]|nr:RsmD family RNA methyltransferase [Myxococcales bacterium]